MMGDFECELCQDGVYIKLLEAKLEAQLSDIGALQRYTGQPFGHTKASVTFVKTDDGGLVLHKDIQAIIEDK